MKEGMAIGGTRAGHAGKMEGKESNLAWCGPREDDNTRTSCRPACLCSSCRSFIFCLRPPATPKTLLFLLLLLLFLFLLPLLLLVLPPPLLCVCCLHLLPNRYWWWRGNDSDGDSDSDNDDDVAWVSFFTRLLRNIHTHKKVTFKCRIEDEKCHVLECTSSKYCFFYLLFFFSTIAITLALFFSLLMLLPLGIVSALKWRMITQQASKQAVMQLPKGRWRSSRHKGRWVVTSQGEVGRHIPTVDVMTQNVEKVGHWHFETSWPYPFFFFFPILFIHLFPYIFAFLSFSSSFLPSIYLCIFLSFLFNFIIFYIYLSFFLSFVFLSIYLSFFLSYFLSFLLFFLIFFLSF